MRPLLLSEYQQRGLSSSEIRDVTEKAGDEVGGLELSWPPLKMKVPGQGTRAGCSNWKCLLANS
jgi:hypothetical protein